MKSLQDIKRDISNAVDAVRKTCPMAGSITNTVTIHFVANTQLAVGGSAAMVYFPDEAEFLAKAAGAFYINLGTPFPIYEETLPHVARVLHQHAIPWVLDPVAIGIGRLRTDILTQFKEYKPSVIRGNASEIIALSGLWNLTEKRVSQVRGVDATESVLDAKSATILLARHTGGAVAVSGKIDLITDGVQIAYSKGGSHFMEKITGAGCSLGGVIAIYLTAASPFIAALTGSQIYNLAAKKAEKKASGPGSFQNLFLDELYHAQADEVAENSLTLEEIL